MKKWIIALFGLGVSAVAIWLVVSKAELRETATLIASAGYRLPILLGALYLVTFPIRALRWQCMLPSGTLTFVEALKGVLVGFAGNNFLPTRGGEFLRMEYLYRKAPQIGRITAISSILVERMLDGLTLLAILVIALDASHREYCGASLAKRVAICRARGVWFSVHWVDCDSSVGRADRRAHAANASSAVALGGDDG